MLNNTCYQLIEIELQNPISPVTLDAHVDGAAFLVRQRGCPCAYFMRAMPGGKTITVAEQASLLRSALPSRPTPQVTVDQETPKSLLTVTVAICTRNRPKELRRALESLQRVRGEAPQRIELSLLVIDNAPVDDATRLVVEDFPAVQYTIEPRPGLSVARNRAIRETRTPYIAFVDDDVVIDRGWLKGLLAGWNVHPEAAGFSGPVLPYAVDTLAQILVEGRGGLGHFFDRTIWSAASRPYPFPVGEACFGAGANMAFRCDALQQIGGFDEALGAGTPTMGGEDLDIFYRLIRAGYSWVHEPSFCVYHEHRREYEELRRQVYTWGLGYVSYLVKCFRHDPGMRPAISWAIARTLLRKFGGLAASALRLRRYPWPVEFAFAELRGSMAGLFGPYQRSERRLPKHCFPPETVSTPVTRAE